MEGAAAVYVKTADAPVCNFNSKGEIVRERAMPVLEGAGLEGRNMDTVSDFMWPRFQSDGTASLSLANMVSASRVMRVG